MRKFFTLLGVAALPLVAQAQSPRFVLLEHFTQASCGPCATYNPALNNILNNNPQMIVSIKYQVSWPGFDPMNLHNPTEVQSRRQYYAVNAVPNAVIDGNYYNDNPAGVTTGTFSNRAAVPSPFTVNVTQTFSPGGDSVRVRTVVKKTATTPAGAALKVHMAVVERNVYFDTPPGSNGETHFESVMKKMLPNASGTDLPALNVGDSAVFTGAWKLANVYNIGEIASVAFVQNNSTKEVYQAGYAAPNFPLSMQLAAINGIAARVAGNNATSNYNVKFNAQGPATDTYHLELDKTTLPADWSASFTINGTTYQDMANIQLNAQDSVDVAVQITTGANPDVKGQVVLRASSATMYSNYIVERPITAYSKITTAFINKKTAANTTFMNSFNAAGTTVVGISETEFQAMDPAGFTDANVDQMFVNTSDLYSGTLFTDAELALMTQYLTSGGDLFMAGQDVGYSAFAGGGNANFKSFFNNYLGATYVSDGNGPMPVNPVPGEGLFGSVTPSALNSQANYPDHVRTYTGAPNAAPILMYNANPTDNAGIRNDGADWKVVYLSIRLESITQANLRNELIDISIDWFNGILNGTEVDAALSAAMLKTYPNPTSNVLNVELSEVPAAATLNVYDVLGRVVLTENVAAGTSTFQLNTSSLQAGTYTYRLEGGVTTAASKLVVVR